MMKKVKFVYFDIGGVLVDHVLALKKIAKQLEISEERTIALFHEYCDKFDRGVLSWSSFEKIFYDKLNISNKLGKSLVEFFVDNFGVIQETHDLINEIKSSVDIGILSNVAEETFRLRK
ncbi:hypothetical protein KJ953_03425 [Patescibacteria group bacterium]|nr:hypothetical protein [Patescibacteria group bacterium]